MPSSENNEFHYDSWDISRKSVSDYAILNGLSLRKLIMKDIEVCFKLNLL